MDLPLNDARPLIMHIDLNSCFAIIEQQANPLIRNRPVAVAAYDSPGGMVIASSYEAKASGIKLGVNVRQARELNPDVTILTPDAQKYRVAHKRFRAVLENYAGTVFPRSVDEFVVDFSTDPAVLAGRELEEIGYEIKERVKESLGEYVTVNVGIGPNRFLAKTAAGWHKPDGLDVITSETVENMYKDIELTDLPGINVRYQARLNIAGIYTPMEFLAADSEMLKKRVFKSKVGVDWYYRLRGWEVDAVQWGRKSFGHQYAIGKKTEDRTELARMLMKLCEKTGRRVRKAGFVAYGVHLNLRFEDRTYWKGSREARDGMFATQDIFWHARRLLDKAIIPARATAISVTVYKLKEANPEQLGLFDNTKLDHKPLATASDIVNDRYGEFTVVPAMMANMDKVILDRIAFGRSDYFTS